MSLSHISLIVHPAPLIKKAPVPKTANIKGSGQQPAWALKAILQPHGQKSNHDPEQ